MALLLAAGCGSPVDSPADEPIDNLEQKGGGWYGGSPNGTGIHVAEDPNNPGKYSFGAMIGGTTPWTPIGYISTARPAGGAPVKPRVIAYYPGSSGQYTTATYAPGQIDYALYNGAMYNSVYITGKQSTVTLYLEFVDTTNYANVIRSVTISGPEVNGVQMHLIIPRVGSPTSLGDGYSYFLMFGAQENLNANSGTVYGHQMYIAQAGAVSWSPYCNIAGSNEQAVFHQGSLFDVMTAARYDSSSYVTMTCKSGGVATCMLWGEIPWLGGYQDSMGNPLNDLKDYHQACIQMKRAAYFGDGRPFTITGTLINRRDSLNPSILKEDMSNLEALWDQNGALCVNDKYRRHPEIPWLGYNINTANPGKPACDATSWSLKWLTASALP